MIDAMSYVLLALALIAVLMMLDIKEHNTKTKLLIHIVLLISMLVIIYNILL